MEHTSSYQDFLRILESKGPYTVEQNEEFEEAIGGILLEDDEEEAQTPDNKLKQLCRVCGSRGLIDIHTVICDKYLTIPRSRLCKLQNYTIATMISQIADEEVFYISVTMHFAKL